MTGFSLLCDWLNCHTSQETFSPIDFIEYQSNKVDYPLLSDSTIYRTFRAFLLAGYIKRHSRGVYSLCKTIPKTLLSTHLIKEAYGSGGLNSVYIENAKRLKESGQELYC